MTFANYINNNVNVKRYKCFAAIIGESPSQGARSPLLWNAAFSAYSINGTMVPFDVTPEQLENLLTALDNDKSFIGGAVTMPYKEVVANWLGKNRITTVASRIGTVNCLYRDKHGRLCGTNTDGEGALISAQQKFSLNSSKKILQLGAGGAGKAVAAYFSHAGHQLTLAVRHTDKLSQFANSIAAELIEWTALEEKLSTTEVLINTTSIGFGKSALTGELPISQEAISLLPHTCNVFDIIYDPCPTPLLQQTIQRGMPILDGKAMNLEQAVLAFNYAIPSSDSIVVRQAMVEKYRELDG